MTSLLSKWGAETVSYKVFSGWFFMEEFGCNCEFLRGAGRKGLRKDDVCPQGGKGLRRDPAETAFRQASKSEPYNQLVSVWRLLESHKILPPLKKRKRKNQHFWSKER